MNRPLVSVILTFFNAEKFIQEAVDSVLAQTYENWELLLVDDNSTDCSAEVALQYAERDLNKVKYLTHNEGRRIGLSASRNLGIHKSRGEYLAFLDADDVWLPQKLQEQVSILLLYREAAMVYGPAQVWYSWTGNPKDFDRDYLQALGVPVNTLIRPPTLVPLFLKSEGDTPCPSSIMVKREAAENVAWFEEDFPGLYEDQVFTSKMCLESPVFVASDCLCKYRQHSQSMVATAKRGHAAARMRFLKWLANYVAERNVRNVEVWGAIRGQLRLWRLLSIHPTIERIAEYASRGLAWLRWLKPHLNPPLLKARVRSTMGLQPLDQKVSFDHGLPIERYYVERFLQESSSDIRGRCLEFQDFGYVLHFGSDRVTRLVILYEGKGVGSEAIDLATWSRIQSESYDCIICVNILNKVLDLDKAITELHRILERDGVLLVSVPQLTKYAYESHDFWRFTARGLRMLLAKAFGEENVAVMSYGNSLLAAGEMRGLAAEAFTKSELDYSDPLFSIEVCAKAVKHQQSN